MIARQLSDAPLRARVFLAGSLGVLGLMGAAWIARQRLPLGDLYPWKAVLLFGTMMTIVAGRIGDYHPFPRLGPANQVTLARAMLLSLVAALIGEPEIPRIAAAGVAAAGMMAALDGVDGWLARRSRMSSRFGARFDMETDALLILALSVLVWRHEKAGVWVLAGGLMRYGFGAAGWLLPWMARPLTPTRRGRIMAVTHVVGLCVALAPIVPTSLSALTAGATLTALSWSFAVDVRRLWREE